MSNDNIDDNAKLVNATIKKYCGQVDDVPSGETKNISIDIKAKDRVYKLVRLSDKQFDLLQYNSIALFNDYTQLMLMSRDKELIFSNRAKMYASLLWQFDESGKCYDDWKCSFSFPFLIYFKNGEEEFGYLMNIINIRSAIEFRLYKLVKSDDEKFKSDSYYNSFDDFPQVEINYVNNYVAGFLSGIFEVIKKQTCEPFFGTVGSNLIVFGCKDGKYFNNQYEEEEQFHEAIKELEKHEIRKIN